MPASSLPPPAFFVYGTLKRGQINDVLLQPHAQSVESAWIRGRLYDLGDFPALDYGDDVVRGELVRVAPAALSNLLGVLDGLEGYCRADEVRSHYLRRVIDVQTDSGPQCRANAYFYNRANALMPDLDLFPRLKEGIWPELHPRGSPVVPELEEFRRHVADYRHNAEHPPASGRGHGKMLMRP